MTQKATPIFDHAHPKIIKVAFGFRNVLVCKKAMYCIYSFLKYSQI